ncbi:MAG: zinc-ribbon domain-containing protein [Candidatus Avispirillum sp.]
MKEVEKMYCTNCGTAVPEGTNFCPKCGASIAVTAAPQPQEPANNEQYTAEPFAAQQSVDGAPQNTENAGVYQQEPQYQPSAAPDYRQPQYQPPVQPAYQQPSAPAYQSEPRVQNIYYTQQPQQQSVSMAPPILSLVFGSIAFFFMLIAVSLGYIDSAAACIVFSVLFGIAAIPLGIVGLVKSIKAKCVKGIVISAIGLGLVLLSYFMIYLIPSSISYVY